MLANENADRDDQEEAALDSGHPGGRRNPRSDDEPLRAISAEFEDDSDEPGWTIGETGKVAEQPDSEKRGQKLADAFRAHRALENLMARADIAAIILDNDLRLQRYTPGAAELFNLASVDGHKLSGQVTDQLDDSLMEDAQRVLRNHISLARYVDDEDDRRLWVHLSPCRRTESRPEGVILIFMYISELKETEQAVRRNEVRLRKVLQIGTVGVIFFDESGTVIDANDTFLELVGYTRRELEAGELTWQKLTPPDWVDESQQRMAQLEETDLIGPYEKEYYRKDDSRSWFLFAGAKLDDGTAVEFCIDISKQKEVEQALLVSQEKYRSLFETMLEAFAVCEVVRDEDGKVSDYRMIELNPAFERLSGIPRSEAVGRRGSEIFPWLEDWYYESYRRAIEAGEPVRVEHYAAFIDHWYDVRVIPRGADRFAVIYDDITERKRAERALRESEARLAREVEALQRLQQMTTRVMTAENIQQALDEILAASLTLLEADLGNIQLLDRESQRLSIVAENGFQRPFLEAFRAVGIDDECSCGRALRGGQRVIVEDIEEDAAYAPYRDVAREAGYRAVQSTPLVSHSGKLLGVLSTHYRQPQSLTDRDEQLLDLLAPHAAGLLEYFQTEKELEARVRERTEQVRRLASELTLAEQEERDRIAQILHDDLQQQLYAMQLQVELVKGIFEDGDEAAFYGQVKELREELDSAIGITRQLNVDLSPAILKHEGLREAIRWLAKQMEEQHHLQVTVQAEESFPMSDEGLRVLLFQGVRELLFNVVKHAGTMQVNVRLDGKNGYVRITIQDYGRGMAMEALHSGTRYGTGLAMIRNRLSLVGGELKIDSVAGRGTQVTIIAPLQVASG